MVACEPAEDHHHKEKDEVGSDTTLDNRSKELRLSNLPCFLRSKRALARVGGIWREVGGGWGGRDLEGGGRRVGWAGFVEGGLRTRHHRSHPVHNRPTPSLSIPTSPIPPHPSRRAHSAPPTPARSRTISYNLVRSRDNLLYPSASRRKNVMYACPRAYAIRARGRPARDHRDGAAPISAAS